MDGGAVVIGHMTAGERWATNPCATSDALGNSPMAGRIRARGFSEGSNWFPNAQGVHMHVLASARRMEDAAVSMSEHSCMQARHNPDNPGRAEIDLGRKDATSNNMLTNTTWQSRLPVSQGSYNERRAQSTTAC